MRFLSDEWLTALADAAGEVSVEGPASLTVEQRVHAQPGDVVWTMTVAGGRLRIEPGPAARPDVGLACDEATARAIAAGRLAAVRALLDGRLTVHGDIDALRSARATLDAVGDVFASVRDATTDLG